MRECSKVPAAAWQLLATARWEQLRKADFYQRLGGRLFKGGDAFLARLRLSRVPRPLFVRDPSATEVPKNSSIEVLQHAFHGGRGRRRAALGLGALPAAAGRVSARGRFCLQL